MAVNNIIELICQDDSMEPRIPKNATVIAEETKNIDSMQYGVFLIENLKVIRQFFLTENGVVLDTINKINYAPLSFTKEQFLSGAVKLLGRVVQIRLKFEDGGLNV